MNTKRYSTLNDDQIEQLLVDVRNLTTDDIGDEELFSDLLDSSKNHFSEEELVDFIFNDMTDDKKNQIETHLKDCEACRQQVEDLKKSAEPWQGEEGEMRLENLRERLLQIAFPGTSTSPPAKPVEQTAHPATLPPTPSASPLVKPDRKLRQIWLSFPIFWVAGPQVGYAKTPPPKPEAFREEDVSWLMSYNEQGDLEITFSSHVWEEGKKLWLRSPGEWSREVKLTDKIDQVGVEVIISSTEMADKNNRLVRDGKVEIYIEFI